MLYPTFTHNSRCITPKMTSNTAPSPAVASASTVYGNYTEHQPWRSFSQVVNASPDIGWSSETVSNSWIQIDLGAGNAELIDSYTLTARGDVFPSDFKTWYLYASNNPASPYDALIDTRSNVNIRTWSLDYGPEMVTFTLPQIEGPYRIFRFYVTQARDSQYPGVGEIQLLRPITGTYNHLTPRGRTRSLMYPTFRR